MPRLLLALAAGLTVGGVLGGLFAAGAVGPNGPPSSSVPPQDQAPDPSGRSGPPPYKQTVEAEETAEQATAEAGYHAPKPTPGGEPPTFTKSCPIDEASIRTGVFEGTPYQPPPDPEMRAIHFVSEAFPGSSSDDGMLYGLYLGYPGSSPFFPDRTPDPEHGLIVVSGPGNKDPCAAGEPPVLPATASRLNVYPLPFSGTPARFTKIDGNGVTFETVDGRTGRFNFITGTFSEEGS
ncbi:MAG: hypothetical protein WEE64_02415 [Dehalococcoidia bacterium]